MEWRWQLLKPLSKKRKGKKKKSPGSNQFMASLQPFTLVSVSQKNKIVCEDGQTWTWIRNNNVPQSLKRRVLTKVLCFHPPGHTLLSKKKKKKIYCRSNLEIFFPFGIALMEVLRTFTSHLWRQTSSSLCSASLRAIGTCNCIARSIRLPLRATHNTEEVIYSPRNTSMPCYSSLFTASVDGEIQGHCTANTGQLHLKHVQYLLVEEAVKESQLYLINSWNKIAQVGQGCSALHVAIF